uniref:Uncharacterized protein n=1 Tax=viral metagenome TaxID=1070528 RepID=A0A6M3JVG4_9ZZZZ
MSTVSKLPTTYIISYGYRHPFTTTMLHISNEIGESMFIPNEVLFGIIEKFGKLNNNYKQQKKYGGEYPTCNISYVGGWNL